MLAITATGSDLAAARAAAYEAVGHIRLPGAQFRTDIAAKAWLARAAGGAARPAGRYGPAP